MYFTWMTSTSQFEIQYFLLAVCDGCIFSLSNIAVVIIAYKPWQPISLL